MAERVYVVNKGFRRRLVEKRQAEMYGEDYATLSRREKVKRVLDYWNARLGING